MAIATDNNGFSRVLPRTLAGATVLQVVPALRDAPQIRVAINIARALVHVGARAIVAGERGELVDALKRFGGEWLPLDTATLNPSKLVANAEALHKIITAEGVHIVHAKTAGAAWSVQHAASRDSIRLVTDIPDLPPRLMWFAAFCLGALARGDRVMAHSMYQARPMMARHHVSPERISVIPRSIDFSRHNPAAVAPEQLVTLRQTWGIPTGMRIVLTPGRVSARNGQLALVRAARILADNGTRNITFVLAGDDRRHPYYVRKFWRQAQVEGVDALFRMVGNHTDMATAYAAADVVVLPCRSPPAHGDLLAEAQAMARPVVATAVGALPEYMLAPPQVSQEQCTGWEVPPGDAIALAEAIAAILTLDDTDYRALAARARKFAERVFSPEHAAAAALEVYASLLVAGG
jgi:glycosyltransferase involved in cell wall biosynthesis